MLKFSLRAHSYQASLLTLKLMLALMLERNILILMASSTPSISNNTAGIFKSGCSISFVIMQFSTKIFPKSILSILPHGLEPLLPSWKSSICHWFLTDTQVSLFMSILTECKHSL